MPMPRGRSWSTLLQRPPTERRPSHSVHPVTQGDTFPRQWARTRRGTLGDARDLTITPDGSTVYFLRARSTSDPVHLLWAVDTATGDERLVVDPAQLSTSGTESAAERARRERLRESADGIAAYHCNRDVTRAVTALAGTAVLIDLDTGRCTTVDLGAAVFDPRLSPDGHRLAVVRDGRLVVVEVPDPATMDTDSAPVITADIGEATPDVAWGMAEFIAAEEMERHRGFWWAPDAENLLVCRVDESTVPVWHISDPAAPWEAPRAVRYPAAGTANAAVTLYVCAANGSSMIPVPWDRTMWEYLARAGWDRWGPWCALQSRDQRTLATFRIDQRTGALTEIHRDHDDHWVELVPGAPVPIGPDAVVTCVDRDGYRRLDIDAHVVTDTTLQVRSVVSADDAGVLFTANPVEDPTVMHLWSWTPQQRLTPVYIGDGVVHAAGDHRRPLWRASTLDNDRPDWHLISSTTITSAAEDILVNPSVHLTRSANGHDVALVLPSEYTGNPLPVLLDPYGGPHARRVVRSRRMFAPSQWFADRGYAVVVCDGRGTPGYGSEGERAVALDLASGVLDDQIAGLDAAVSLADRLGATLDTSRVGIRGWSFGGYLAALAVLRRPDVVHAAIAGAPVTDWRWYDTHYTERYLGHPDDEPAAYSSTSLIDGLAALERPLLLIHGLADDNVVAAHTLRLSSALLAAGAPHEVLPLVGVTHMTPQEVVAENLLLHQAEFLDRHLSPTAGTGMSTV